MKILFDAAHLYYLPQYLPVIAALAKRGIVPGVLFMSDKDAEAESAVRQAGGVSHVLTEPSRVDHYRRASPDWLVVGSGDGELREALKGTMRMGLMMHGTDVSFKNACDADWQGHVDVRFVGSPCRTQPLQALFPDTYMVETGYAKLDPLFNDEGKVDLSLPFQLEAGKKTILYAPTFYPSSIERLGRRWPEQYRDFNLLIKPHHFSLEKRRYVKQRLILEHWAANYPHVTLAQREWNLLPFIKAADLMISDASSATFEFAALDKPVVVCNFLALRWNYRGPFRYRFNRRMAQQRAEQLGLFHFAENPRQLREMVARGVGGPAHQTAQAQQWIFDTVGSRDGHASDRVADFLLNPSAMDAGPRRQSG